MNIKYAYHSRKNYSSTQVHHYTLNDDSFFAPSSPPTVVTNNSYIYHYSSYHDWLLQNINTLMICRLSDKNFISLDQKKIIVHKKYDAQTFFLRDVYGAHFTFKRLIFPLILGGIIAPLSLLATTNQVMNLPSGLLTTVVSLFIFYYGWRGSYQIHLEFKTHQVRYFSDEKGDKLKKLVNEINKIIKKRYHSV